ncbi:MAG: exodeoxyribonuclease VII small subunit [Pirellulales bacterium]|nr:exodeoxyribonuclease VII small subunit [Pirellulales bacterium]
MSKKNMKENMESSLSFEQSLARLEEIVHQLEEGNVGLEESLARYEEGVKLLRQAYDLLQKAERKIEILSGVDAEGNPVTEPFDDTATYGKEKE